MYVTTNSALAWKRMADENQRSAKIMARLCTALAAIVLAMGAYAYSAQERYNKLCTTIEIKSGAAPTYEARRFGESIASTYCG